MTTTPHVTPRGIARNPYATVEWSRVIHCLSQFHLHEPRNQIDPESTGHCPPADADIEETERSTPAALVEKYQGAGYGAMAITEHEYYLDGVKHKGEPFFADLDTTTWPWSRRDRGDGDMVPIEGAELRGTIDGVDRLHDIVSLDNDLGHGRERSLRAVADEIAERGGVAFLPHPGKYVDPDSIGAYVSLFESSDSLVGIEAFNANDRYPNSRPVWDALLTELGGERPVWGLANDDYHAKQRDPGNGRFDQSRTVLLVEEETPAAMMEALKDGRSYLQYNGEGEAPRIDAVTVRDGVVKIEAPGATEIRWISDGEPVADGPTVDLATVDGGYVRAEVFGDEGAVSCTQPVFLE